MAKELSELLAELSTQAKNVEDDFAAIAEETDAKAAERRDRTRAAATAAVDSLEQGVSSVEDVGRWPLAGAAGPRQLGGRGHSSGYCGAAARARR